MKKTVFYISVAALALASLAACQKNGPKQFAESEAFVAFASPTATIAEAVAALPSQEDEAVLGFLPQTATLKIPVTLASIKGIEETVKFTVKEDDFMYKDYQDPEGDLEDESNWIERTAHSGINFNLLTTSGTLSFDAENRTRYIEFEILYVPDYTKDMKFDIVLTKPESVALGFNSTCVVTISDVNHPLTPMLGEYAMTGENYWYGMQTWTIELKKDAADDHMIWIDNIFNNSGWSGDDMMYYGNVDADMTTITMPYGQGSEYLYGAAKQPFYFYGFDGSSSIDSGNMVIQILKNEEGAVTGLKWDEADGFWVMTFNDEEHTSNANLAIFKPGKLSAVKL